MQLPNTDETKRWIADQQRGATYSVSLGLITAGVLFYVFRDQVNIGPILPPLMIIVGAVMVVGLLSRRLFGS